MKTGIYFLFYLKRKGSWTLMSHVYKVSYSTLTFWVTLLWPVPWPNPFSFIYFLWYLLKDQPFCFSSLPSTSVSFFLSFKKGEKEGAKVHLSRHNTLDDFSRFTDSIPTNFTFWILRRRHRFLLYSFLEREVGEQRSVEFLPVLVSFPLFCLTQQSRSICYNYLQYKTKVNWNNDKNPQFSWISISVVHTYDRPNHITPKDKYYVRFKLQEMSRQNR